MNALETDALVIFTLSAFVPDFNTAGIFLSVLFLSQPRMLVVSSESGVETAAAWVVALNVALAKHWVSCVYGVVKQLWYKPGRVHAVNL